MAKKKKRERVFLHGEINFEVIPVLAVPKGKVNKQTMWHYRETKPEGKAGQSVPRKYIYIAHQKRPVK